MAGSHIEQSVIRIVQLVTDSIHCPAPGPGGEAAEPVSSDRCANAPPQRCSDSEVQSSRGRTLLVPVDLWRRFDASAPETAFWALRVLSLLGPLKPQAEKHRGFGGGCAFLALHEVEVSAGCRCLQNLAC